MKSYARKQKFNLNMAKLRLQVESALFIIKGRLIRALT